MPENTDQTLAFAINDLNFKAVTRVLNSGLNPNNATGKTSHLHAALNAWVKSAQGVKLNNLNVTNDVGSLKQDPNSARKAKIIGMLLMASGARLDHVPAGAKAPSCPLNDKNLWQMPALAAEIMIVALHSAIKLGHDTPRLDAGTMAEATLSRVAMLTPERAQTELDLSRTIVKELQKEVSQRLRNHGPSDEMARTVAREMKDHDRAVWLRPSGDPIQSRAVELRANAPR